jgi:hypothetical protein
MEVHVNILQQILVNWIQWVIRTSTFSRPCYPNQVNEVALCGRSNDNESYRKKSASAVGIDRVPGRAGGGCCSHYTTEGGAAGREKRAVLVCSSLDLQNGWNLLPSCCREITNTEIQTSQTDRTQGAAMLNDFQSFVTTSKVSSGLPKFRFDGAIDFNGLHGMVKWVYMKVHSILKI